MSNESTKPLLVNGYVKSKLVPPRFETEEFATFEAFKSRANLFSILEPELVSELSQPSLVSSVHGVIQRLFFTIPHWVFFPERYPNEAALIQKYADAFRSIISTLPTNTIRTIFTHKRAEQKANQWIQDLGVAGKAELITVTNDLEFTVWAEDAYCICNDLHDDEKYFVEPASFKRAHDAYIADYAVKSTDLKATQLQLYFQGGNVLIGDNFWFIGADYPAKSLKLGFIVPGPNESERDAVKRVYGKHMDTSRDLIVIGSRVPVPSQKKRPVMVNGQLWDEILYFGNGIGTVQPLFHIDMFITLAGRSENNIYTVLVADPNMAYEILNEEVPEGTMQPVFNDIANQLNTLGFNVIRNPMPMAYDDDDNKKRRYWYFATSNNVILQDSEKKVWIPTYGHDYWSNLSATDDANREIWRSLGYEVQQLPNFHPFAANLGAAHCITKYLARV